jgi:hypothetical protein
MRERRRPKDDRELIQTFHPTPTGKNEKACRRMLAEQLAAAFAKAVEQNGRVASAKKVEIPQDIELKSGDMLTKKDVEEIRSWAHDLVARFLGTGLAPIPAEMPQHISAVFEHATLLEKVIDEDRASTDAVVALQRDPFGEIIGCAIALLSEIDPQRENTVLAKWIGATPGAGDLPALRNTLDLMIADRLS